MQADPILLTCRLYLVREVSPSPFPSTKSPSTEVSSPPAKLNCAPSDNNLQTHTHTHMRSMMEPWCLLSSDYCWIDKQGPPCTMQTPAQHVPHNNAQHVRRQRAGQHARVEWSHRRARQASNKAGRWGCTPPLPIMPLTHDCISSCWMRRSRRERPTHSAALYPNQSAKARSTHTTLPFMRQWILITWKCFPGWRREEGVGGEGSSVCACGGVGVCSGRLT